MPTCERIVERGWGRAFGIYLASRAGLHALRRHLRSLLEVRSPERTRLFFRYYDPRVLRSFLPTCDAAQLRELFGPIERFDLEAPDGTELVRFRIVPEPPSATRPSPTLTLRSWTYPLAGWDAASDDRGRLVTLAAPSPAP